VTSRLSRGGKPAKPGEAESAWRGRALAVVAPLFCVVLLVLISAGTQDLLRAIFTRGTAAEQPLLAAAAVPQPGSAAVAAGSTTPPATMSTSAAGAAMTAPPAAKKKPGLWLTSPADRPPFQGEAGQVLLAIAALFGLGNLMGYFVSVNRFSLQGMYRNRLIRAYLGASNTRRRPNLFTGFDERDNLRMHALRTTKRPLHVVNMALNLVAGNDLAWQQRKAESFTATPLHCGAPDLGFRRAEVYGGQHGISLGTAVATSGAAANPNMGYHSSPALTFIMTLFNARLGIWLGNPGKLGRYTAARGGPRISSRVIFEEAMGQTDCTHPYVNLSDGGHFENLGLYEMVRRRCRFILVCDAGGDPTHAFEDLGNAIRKIRIDLGISIDFDDRIHVYAKARPGAAVPADARYCAIGTIRYQQVDGGKAPEGALIYLKPAICDTEPYDVTNYAKSSATFPHETTADQWFSESQFESYRALGRTALMKMAGPGLVANLDELKARVTTYIRGA